MLIAIHEFQRYAHCYWWIFMVNALQGVKLNAHCYT